MIRLVEAPVPEPGPGEIRIRVEAAGLGLPDVMMCRGSYAFHPTLPFIPGQEVVGIVDAVGDGVRLPVGPPRHGCDGVLSRLRRARRLRAGARSFSLRSTR